MENGSRYSTTDSSRQGRNNRDAATVPERVDPGLYTKQEAAEPKQEKVHKAAVFMGQFSLKMATLKNKYFGGEEAIDLSGRLAAYEPEPVEVESPEATIDLTGSETLVDVELMVSRMESRGFAKEAPRVEDQAQDQTRRNKITHVTAPYPKMGKEAFGQEAVEEVTEHEALNRLLLFLDTVASESEYDSRREAARTLAENLTFIGEKEYQEATAAIANMWKRYLDSDPKKQLCILTEISKSAKKVKSDMFLLDSILAHFDDAELKKYQGRLLNDPEELTAQPEDARVVLLDDWVISGSQMREAYNDITSNSRMRPYLKSIEINLIVTSDPRIENGLVVSGAWSDEDIHVPVKGYFKAHESSISANEHKAHVTGFHSSVDFDFESSFITQMAREFYAPLPPPANIVRQYRRSTLPNIKRLTGRQALDTPSTPPESLWAREGAWL